MVSFNLFFLLSCVQKNKGVSQEKLELEKSLITYNRDSSNFDYYFDRRNVENPIEEIYELAREIERIKYLENNFKKVLAKNGNRKEIMECYNELNKFIPVNGDLDFILNGSNDIKTKEFKLLIAHNFQRRVAGYKSLVWLEIYKKDKEDLEMLLK